MGKSSAQGLLCSLRAGWFARLRTPPLPCLDVLILCTAAALQHGPTRRRFNCETRMSLAVAGSFEAAHYLQAQKIRTRAEAFYR